MKKKYRLPVAVFVFVVIFLSAIQLNLDTKIFLLERFVRGGGWIEIFCIGFYGAFIAYKIQDVTKSAKWRRISWTLFSIVFFSQLIIGLAGYDKFLMTGKLHLPIPVMIMSGPVFRGELSIMTFLFLSTLVLTGPAWCSQLCYFGALDNLSALRRKPAKGKIRNRKSIKFTLLFIIISVTILLRWMDVPILFATAIAIAFGIAGIIIIIFVSGKKGKMIHCLTWCPIGTLVNYGKYINPFRMYIDSSCTLCMKCTTACKYDALNPEDIRSGKPSVTCTFCGDCLSACHTSSIKYRFLRLKPDQARKLYLFLTVSFHAIFLALGRI